MSLIHKEKKSTPHRVKDAEVSRALEGVYKELNALKESVNNFKSKKEDENGDTEMRFKTSKTNKYFWRWACAILILCSCIYLYIY